MSRQVSEEPPLSKNAQDGPTNPSAKASAAVQALKSKDGPGGFKYGHGSGRGHVHKSERGSKTEPEASPATATEAFNRLATGGRQPWVATKTDSELFTYLAQRSNDPSLAKRAQTGEEEPPKVPSPSPVSGRASPRGLSPKPSRHRKHETHTELFDTLLRQDQPHLNHTALATHTLRTSSRNSARGPSRKKAGSRSEMSADSTMTPGASMLNSRLSDLTIEDIPVLPEDPVAAFFEGEAARRDVSSKVNMGNRASSFKTKEVGAARGNSPSDF